MTYGPAAIPLAWALLLMLLLGWVAIVLGVSAIAYSPGALNTSWAYDWALRNMWRVGVATVCCVIFVIEYVAALLAWRHRTLVVIEVRHLWRQMETELHRLAADIITTR